MDTTQVVQGAGVGAATGVAIAGTIGAPVIIAGMIGLVAIGALAAVFGMIAGNSSEGKMSLSQGGMEASYKK